MSEQRRQHLYLIFDDWHSGYSIRKVSLSRRSSKRRPSKQSPDDSGGEDSGSDKPAAALPSGGSGAGAAKPPPPPLPVFMRVSALRGHPHFFTPAFGAKIMAMNPLPRRSRSGDDDTMGDLVPTIHVDDLTITFEHIAPNHMLSPTYIPVADDRLIALDMCTSEVLRKPEPSGGQPWWEPEPEPEQWWGWEQLTLPDRLMFLDVASYVAQPDGCSVLVSTTTKSSCGACTFILDTTTSQEYVGKLYADWVFPFTGRGHYDTSLAAFVGLSKHPKTLGYLYCCTVSSMASTGTAATSMPHLTTSLDFKCTKEKVYNKNPAEGQHVSATLVHLRPARFCLVECVCTDGSGMADYEELPVPLLGDPFYYQGGGPQGGRFMYRLKTFSLSYDTKGEYLKLKHCRVRCYSLPHDARIGSIHQDPVAFWL